jgi:hypothetical protein
MIALLPLLLAAAPALTPDLTGSWDLEAGGTTIFRLEIAKAPDGMAVTWIRPYDFLADGSSFSDLTGPVVRRKARDIRKVDGDLDVTFDDPQPRVLRLHRVDANHIDVSYKMLGLGWEPFHFTRSKPHPAALGPWDGKRTYALAFTYPTNPEMTAIFKADQAVRQGDASRIDWSVVEPADENAASARRNCSIPASCTAPRIIMARLSSSSMAASRRIF